MVAVVSKGVQAMSILRKTISRVAAVGVLLTAGAAVAGSVSNQTVAFSTTGGLLDAKGTFKPVRNSADAVQFIGCSRYAYDTGSTSIVCMATNAAGQSRSCQTSNNEMLRVAENLNPASYLYFVINADGSCDRVIATNYSFNL
jgi:hypothetical protein